MTGARRLRAMLPIALVISLWPAAALAPAETLEPTRFDDPVPNGCRPSNCSLREAVIAANARQSRTTILLERGKYELEIVQDQNNTQVAGDLNLFTELTIRGEGRPTRISAEAIDDRVVHVGAFEPAPTTLRALTIEDGRAPSGPNALLGGGVLALSADLRLKDVRVRGNSTSDLGGGMFAFDSTARINRSTIKRNSADTAGGGLYSERADLSVKRSTFARNSSPRGGGLYMPDAGEAPNTGRVETSTFSANTADLGAGVMLDDDQLFGGPVEPSLELVNSTLAGNLANVSGGGISAILGAQATIDNATMAHNKADADDSGGGAGGGIHQSTGATVVLGDSLIAANSVGSTGAGQQCAGAFQGLGGNVVQLQPGTACSISGALNEPADALIGPLDQNGGPTKTVALLAGSSALGFAETCPATDQRGVARPTVDCDAGSFEREGP